MIPLALKTVNEIYAHFVATHDPAQRTMCYESEAITLGQLQAHVDRMTRQLGQLGVKPGTFVGYSMPNCPELFYLFLALARLGACAVPLFHMLPDRAKVDIFKRARVQWVITTAGQLSSLKEHSLAGAAGYKLASIDASPDADYSFASPVDQALNLGDYIIRTPQPELPLLVTASSGTTGIPKSVIWTQANIAAEIHAAIELVSPVDSYGAQSYSAAIAFPLSTSGIATCLGTLFSGVCQIFAADPSPVKYLQLLSQWQVDCLSAPPAYFEAILALPILDQFDLRSVKRVATGMDFFSQSLLQRLKARFVNLSSFANGYGLVETTNVILCCKAATEQELAQPTNRMSLVEHMGNRIDVRDEEGKSVPAGGVGELYVQGANVVSGYVGNPEETQKSFVDGWFKTGDIVRNEGANTVTLLGRKKYLIKRGGKSVSPVIVQNHINQLEQVKDSAVVGVPHQLFGEMVWAFVVGKTGYDLQLKDIMRHCRTELPNYMVPDQVTFINEIPKNPGVGKVNVERLRDLASSELTTMDVQHAE